MDLLKTGTAVFSHCGTYRYRLDRRLTATGTLFGYFGVNGSTAKGDEEDQTTLKWNGFTMRNGGRGYIVGNPYAYTATDVRNLASAKDPIGPENDRYIAEIIAEAEVLVPCWGSRLKLPPALRPRLDWLRARIFESGKPVRIFGLTHSGDPKHPLMLGYDTPLVAWPRP